MPRKTRRVPPAAAARPRRPGPATPSRPLVRRRPRLRPSPTPPCARATAGLPVRQLWRPHAGRGAPAGVPSRRRQRRVSTTRTGPPPSPTTPRPSPAASTPPTSAPTSAPPTATLHQPQQALEQYAAAQREDPAARKQPAQPGHRLRLRPARLRPGHRPSGSSTCSASRRAGTSPMSGTSWPSHSRTVHRSSASAALKLTCRML